MTVTADPVPANADSTTDGPDPTEVPSLDGRTFCTPSSGESGEAGPDTMFLYREESGAIWASYAGGAVELGFLVGTRRGNLVSFRYSQLNAAGETANGRCDSTVSVLPDKRLRMDEVWAWESREGAGTSVVEEVPRSRAALLAVA